MPIYEYLCQQCDSHVEVFLHSASQTPECPECGSKKLEKQLSVVSAPVVAGGDNSATRQGENCGRSACASGCMFGNS